MTIQLDLGQHTKEPPDLDPIRSSAHPVTVIYAIPSQQIDGSRLVGARFGILELSNTTPSPLGGAHLGNSGRTAGKYTAACFRPRRRC